jgi:hypothetical protein
MYFAQAEVSKRQYSSKAKGSNVRDFLPVIGTVDADRGIARVNRATRARAFGTCLRAQFGTGHL